MSPKAIGQLSMIMIDIGQWSVFNKILCVKTKFFSMKQELAPEFKEQM